VARQHLSYAVQQFFRTAAPTRSSCAYTTRRPRHPHLAVGFNLVGPSRQVGREAARAHRSQHAPSSSTDPANSLFNLAVRDTATV